MPRAGVVAPTKISQLLAVLALVTLAVQPACVPVPVVMAPSVFPVVVQYATEPAGAGFTQLLVVVYLIESAKYASSAVTRLRRSDFIEARYEIGRALCRVRVSMAVIVVLINNKKNS